VAARQATGAMRLHARVDCAKNRRMTILLATDWATVSSLATGGGTLVLAVATFASVRSSNRSARIAEAALAEQRRPVLAPSRLEDPTQKIMFVDGHWVRASGGHAAVECVDGVVYLAISLRNVGSGIAVCQGWVAKPGLGTSRTMPSHAPLEEFHVQSRDLYVPAGDIGMWQGALRSPDDPVRAALADAVDAGQPLLVELLYSDQVGGQRTVTRFGLIPAKDSWLASMNRHWHLDWEGPRPDRDVRVAGAAVLRDHEALAERRLEAARSDPAAEGDGSMGASDDPAVMDGDGVVDAGTAGPANLG
jgi:hypothetical protein